MAIGTIQGAAGFYDPNRDMYYDDARRYDREMQYRRLQEEEYRRMQQYAFYNAPGDAPKRDPKDPLAFLTKTDNKILLTGEAT